MELFRHLMQILEALVPTSVNAHVGGGAVRDLALALGKPKDLDVVLLAPDDEQIRRAVEALGWLGYVPTETFGITDVLTCLPSTESHPDVEYAAENGDGTFDERWRVLVKFRQAVTGMELDLLCSHTDDIQELVGSYDYNINQYVLHPGRMSIDFLGQHQGVLVKLRADGVCLNRQTKMYQKGIAAGWNVAGAIPETQGGMTNEEVDAGLPY